jgi:tetratricopeptide (TPR) repeat protein
MTLLTIIDEAPAKLLPHLRDPDRKGYLKEWLYLAGILFFTWQPLQAANPAAEGWAKKGSNAFAAGDFPTASDCFQRAVDSDPSEVTYLIDLANASIQTGQFAVGQHALEIGIPKFSDPAKQAQLWAALADLHIGLGEKFQAVIRFSRSHSAIFGGL